MLGFWQIEAQDGLTEPAQAESAVAELGTKLLDIIEEAKVLASQAEAAARLLLVCRIPAEPNQSCRRIPAPGKATAHAQSQSQRHIDMAEAGKA